MDEKQPEGNSGGDGGADANPPSSTASSQPSGANLAETIAQLQKKVNEQEGEIRALKGGKDKAVDRAIKSQEATLAKLAKYLNVDEKTLQEAQRQSVLDELVAERTGGFSSSQPIQGRVGAADDAAGLRAVDNFSVADAIAEVETYELSPNDPDFINLLRKGVNREGVRDYILERKKPPKPASPADVTQSPVLSSARGEKTPAQLEAEYQKEAGAILQSKSGDERIRALAELKAKYRGLGLPKN